MSKLTLLFIVSAGSFALSALLTPVVRSIARATGRVAKPKADRWHRTPTALLGGIAVYVCTAIALLIVVGPAAFVRPVFFAATAMFVLGLVDDLIALRPMTKLGAQLIAASFVIYFGLTLGWTGSQPIDQLLTVLWLVGITNAFNLLDNMDGLCAGIALIATVTLGFTFTLGTTTALEAHLVYAAGLAGALAGFLIYNSAPASIFLGDSGSLFIGFSLAGLSLVGSDRSSVVSTVAVPGLLLLIPIFDTVLVTLARKLSGRPVSQGGTDHASHRLVAIGFSERRAVLILYLLAATAGAASITVLRAYPASGVIVAALVLVAIVLVGVYLARVRVYQDKDFSALRNARYTPLLVHLTFRRRLFEVILDFVLISIAYYAAYRLRFEGGAFDLYTDLVAESLPIVLGLKMLGLQLAGVYGGVWKYFSLSDGGRILKGTLLGSGMSVLAMVYLYRFNEFSRAVFAIDAMLLLLLMTGARVSFRLIDEFANHSQRQGRRVLIYGAGDGGSLLVRELFNNRKHGYRPIGFIDDDPAKKRRTIHGLPVLGGPDAVEGLVAQRRCDLIIISTNKLDDIRRATLKRLCAQAGMPLLEASFRLDPVGSGSDEAATESFRLVR